MEECRNERMGEWSSGGMKDWEWYNEGAGPKVKHRLGLCSQYNLLQ